MLLSPLLALQAPTPPERLLGDYLRAFNERNGAGLPAFLRDRFAWPADRPGLMKEVAEAQAKLRRGTGGLDFRGVAELRAGSVVANVRSRRLGTWSRLSVYLEAQPPAYEKPTTPYRIVGLGMSDVAAPERVLPRRALSDAEIARRMGGLMNRLVADDAFSGAVLVARRGKPIFARAYGLANRSYGAPNTMAMRFNLASITKMFTAVAVAQLVEAGKLAFDDPVGKILPDYPNADVATRVTVRHLLTHTSGMIGARELAGKDAPEPARKARTIDAQIPTFVREPLAFAPGERFDYSNAGYILLGKIVERASGESYYDYVQAHVFKRAGMAHAAFLELDLPTRNVASGYADGPRGTRRDNVFDLEPRGHSAGGAYATAEDMDRFGRALIAGRLVRPATLARMWGAAAPTGEAGRDYGYGAYVERYAGRRVVSHGGGWKGITDRFEMIPGLGVTITVLGNTDSDPNAIAYKAREWTIQGHAISPTSKR